MGINYIKLFALVSLILCMTANFIQAQDKLTIDQLKTDFSLFKQAMKEAHPGLYRYNTKGQIDSLFVQTENLISHEMTQQEFYRLLLPLVVQIKCGHTKFHPDNNWTSNFYFNVEKVFPWRLHFDGEKAYVLGDYFNSGDMPKGAEVVSIQGKPMPEIIREMLPAFFSDGNNITFKYLEMDHYFSAYYANLFEGPDTFSLVYKMNNELKEHKIAAISHLVIEEYEKQQEALKANIPPYSLKLVSGETALLTIRSFGKK